MTIGSLFCFSSILVFLNHKFSGLFLAVILCYFDISFLFFRLCDDRKTSPQLQSHNGSIHVDINARSTKRSRTLPWVFTNFLFFFSSYWLGQLDLLLIKMLFVLPIHLAARDFLAVLRKSLVKFSFFRPLDVYE